MNTPNGDNVDGGYHYTDSIVYIRAERDMDSIRSYFSSDGINWIKAFTISDRPIYWAGINSTRYPWDGQTSIDTHAYFDYFIVGYNYILPVNLLNFNAIKSNNVVQIKWTTSQEVNTNYFELQRSSDGRQFNTITTVPAAGNSQTQKNYFVTDKLPVEGNNFYQLKMIDKDGKSTYSNIQVVKFVKVNTIFTVFPNPTKDFLNIVSSNDNNDAQVKITDLSGKTLYSTKQIFTAGQQYKVSISQFSKQVLIITIQSNNEKEQFKIIKE